MRQHKDEDTNIIDKTPVMGEISCSTEMKASANRLPIVGLSDMNVIGNTGVMPEINMNEISNLDDMHEFSGMTNLNS